LESGFSDWLSEANYFCNTLVDRIVSGYPEESALKIQERTGFEDPLLVAGEYFHSWVIQGADFLAECGTIRQSPLNIQFVQDLNPYREMKVRILNGAHILMVPVGRLMGLTYVHECMEDSDALRFMNELLEKEICPSLEIPQVEVMAFKESVYTRFRNPFIKHELRSIALNAIPKYKTRVLPSLMAIQQSRKETPHRILFATAALICYYRGTYYGREILLHDAKDTLKFFEEKWQDYRATPETALELVTEVLRFPGMTGSEGAVLPQYGRQIANYLLSIEQKGLRKAIHSIPNF